MFPRRLTALSAVTGMTLHGRRSAIADNRLEDSIEVLRAELPLLRRNTLERDCPGQGCSNNADANALASAAGSAGATINTVSG